VHSKIWAHFLVQYLPKINYINYLISLTGNSLTLLTPEYNDPQINEIINSIKMRYNELEVIKLSDGQAAHCEILYHIENLSIISDHSSYISPSDIVIPHIVKSFLKDKFICDPLLFPSSGGPLKMPFRKIFLSRKVSSLSPLSNMRNIENQDEVESYFVNKGFEVIFPHEYDLDQKSRIFSEAKIIVGPLSSGFTNLIFCQSGTKVLAFGNYQRIYDTYITSLADHFNIDLLFVADYDIEPFNIHSSYNIPLLKIIDAFQNLMKDHG
jgi:capsular polysaccharide biosynthesis protein